jgi:hypothetical protein
MALNCVNSTVSYSDAAKGFPSFYSYHPEYMIGMNSFFYSFKGGNLWRHNTNETRNSFYDSKYETTITSVFNAEPTLSIKLFKTLSYESTTTSVDTTQAAWECVSLNTDLTDGSPGGMLETYFVQKEGEWFSYLRTNEGNLNWKERSANGIGTCIGITGSGATVLLEFSISPGTIISVGDAVYGVTLSSGVATTTPILNGTVVAVKQSTTGGNLNTITINTTITGASVPTVGQYIMFIKNSVAESHGARGYYLEFKLSNNSEVAVELFSVGSSVMKSNP